VLIRGRNRAFGFLSGAVLAGGSLYYYLVDEYKSSNQLLTEDIYVCKRATPPIEQPLSGYIANAGNRHYNPPW
jgi:hypothetical protein